ncbi:MAG: hypothetical protein U5K36_06410 [Roseovarius sp.]|nr:hypothetical protein [Roseovarius sp.]
MNRFIETGAAALLALGLATPALGWSCASDEELVATATPEERARISAEIARQRAWAEAMTCIEAGGKECPDPPDLSQPLNLPAGD